jgi:hypothetical protein
MKRSNAALALIFAGAVTCGLGCGDSGQKAGASAEPGKSGAAATTAAKPSGTAMAGKSSAAPSTAKPVEPAKAAGADVLRHMPKDCDEGRIFANVGKILEGGAGSSLDSLVAMGMSMGKDAKKGEAVMKAFKDGGVDPLNDIREVAVCATSDKKKMVAAVYFESKADKPAETFAKALEAAYGKPPTKEEAGDVTFLKAEKEGYMAFVGKNVVLIGDDKAPLEAAAKGGDGAGEFGEAKSHAIWAKMKDKDTQVMMKEAGSDWDLKVVTKAGPKAQKQKEDFEKMLPELDKQVEKMPILKPLLPVAKNAKMEVAGEVLTVTTKFPKSALGEFLKEAGKSKPDELMKGLKF